MVEDSIDTQYKCQRCRILCMWCDSRRWFKNLKMSDCCSHSVWTCSGVAIPKPMETVLIIEGFVCHRWQHSLGCQTVIWPGIHIQVGIDGLSVYFMAQGSIWSSICARRASGWVALFMILWLIACFGECCSGDVEVLQLFRSVMPDCSCFVSLLETAEVIVGCPVVYSTMKNLAITGNGSGPMTTLWVCS